MKIYNREFFLLGFVLLAFSIGEIFEGVSKGDFSAYVIMWIMVGATCVVICFVNAFRKKNAVDYNSWSKGRKKWDTASKVFEILFAVFMLTSFFFSSSTYLILSIVSVVIFLILDFLSKHM